MSFTTYTLKLRTYNISMKLTEEGGLAWHSEMILNSRRIDGI